MRRYVARKGDRWYAVVYEGLDPVSGRERRRWHPAGTSRAEAEQLAARLAAEANGRNDKVRSLTVGAYLTNTWLPGKRINLAESTWDGYRRKIDRHIVPVIGHLRIRRLRAHHLDALYDRMLHPKGGSRSLAPKTVLEVHLIIRGALNDAVKRGLVNRNVALIAHAPKLRSIPKIEPQAWNAQQLQAFLQAAAGHRLFPAFWVLASTGMRRSELLGLRWNDVDLKKARLSVNRGLVAVAYELHESRGKTTNSSSSSTGSRPPSPTPSSSPRWRRAAAEQGIAVKTDIHPTYDTTTVICSCGNTFTTRSTKPGDMHIELCNECHPFYTGKQKVVDSGGRVERFQRRYGKSTFTKAGEQPAESGEEDAE